MASGSNGVPQSRNRLSMRPELLVAAVLASAAAAQLSAMNCTLRVEMAAADFDLSSEAEAGIRFKEGTEQNETGFQSLECECVERASAADKTKSASANLIKSRVKAQRKLQGDFVEVTDADVAWLDSPESGLYVAGELDWSISAVFRLARCNKLALELNQGPDSLAGRLDGAVIIVEDVQWLEIDDFRAGILGAGENFNEGTFSSIYFRSVVFHNIRPTHGISVDEKAEVLFHNVSLADGVRLNVNSNNRAAAISPVIRVEHSTFDTTEVNVEDGIGPAEETFTIEVVNEQPRTTQSRKGSASGSAMSSAAPSSASSSTPGSSWHPTSSFPYMQSAPTTFKEFLYLKSRQSEEPCGHNSKGAVIVSNNTFGALSKNAIRVVGGESFEFSGNAVDVAASEAFLLQNVKDASVTANRFGYILKQPLVTVEYKKKGPSVSGDTCDEDDLPEAEIVGLDFSANTIPKLDEERPLIKTEIDPSYSDELIGDKMNLGNNSASSPCKCEKANRTVSNDSDVELVPAKIGRAETLRDERAEKADGGGVDATLHKMLLDNAACQFTNSRGRLVTLSKGAFCAGAFPPGEEASQDLTAAAVRSQWSVYLVVAVILTALITACLSAVCARVFFGAGTGGSSSEVGPKSRA